MTHDQYFVTISGRNFLFVRKAMKQTFLKKRHYYSERYRNKDVTEITKKQCETKAETIQTNESMTQKNIESNKED